LLHDNARPHIAFHTFQTLVKLGFRVLEVPAYSPDLVPSDYHLLGPLKVVFRGRRFTSDEGVKEVVHEWLAAQKKDFFLRLIRGFWKAGKSALQSTANILKNVIILRSLLLLKKIIKIVCRYLLTYSRIACILISPLHFFIAGIYSLITLAF